MKSITPYLVGLIAVISSCHQPDKQATPSTADTTVKNHLPGYPGASPLIQSYAHYLTTLDTTDLTIGQPAFREFQQRFDAQPPEVCDTGFMLFYSLLRQINTDTAVKRLFGEYSVDTLAAAEEMGSELSSRGKAYRRALEQDFFIVHEDEGNGYLVPGWRLMSTPFNRYITKTMKEVITESIKDDQEGFQNDAGLTMTPQQLAHRTVWWEGFMARYPHHIYTEWAHTNFNMLLFTMVNGLDNSPVTDFDSAFKLNPFFDTAYSVVRDSFPASRTNTVITPFWQAVLTRDSTTMKRIRDSLPSM